MSVGLCAEVEGLVWRADQSSGIHPPVDAPPPTGYSLWSWSEGPAVATAAGSPSGPTCPTAAATPPASRWHRLPPQHHGTGAVRGDTHPVMCRAQASSGRATSATHTPRHRGFAKRAATPRAVLRGSVWAVGLANILMFRGSVPARRATSVRQVGRDWKDPTELKDTQRSRGRRSPGGGCGTVRARRPPVLAATHNPLSPIRKIATL
jgi:hypothetical protein